MMDSGKLSWNRIIVMILQTSLYFWLLACTLLLPGIADDSQIIRGVPGKDYPNFDEIPQTYFRCSEHTPGFHADPETGCQVFHHCYEHRQESFLCPLGTIFNQAILSCDYWYSADCSAATLYYGVNSPHKVINFDSEIEFVPVRNPSVNVFDKMASLYEVKEPVPTDSKYEFRDYSYEENHFDDDEIIVKNALMIENQKYTDNYVQVTNHHDRRDGVLVESPDEQDYFQDNLNRENIQNLEDSLEGSGDSSGESENIEDLIFSEDHLSLSPIYKEEDIGFEEPYYTVYNNDSHKENEVQHDHINNEEETINSNSDFANEQTISLTHRDKFVRRQSEDTENLKKRRKNKRRKPLYTVEEPEANMDYLTATKNKIKINANNPVSDYTTFSFTEEPVTESRTLSTSTPPSRTKRRKPIMIDLEDSLQYNVHSGQNADGGIKTSSIKYEVNPQSEMTGFPISAHEISLKLFPSEVRRKRKPANAYFLDPLKHYNAGTERNVELSSVNNIGSSMPNIYETSTFPTTEEMETHDDVLVDLNRLYPKRKKNIIHVFDFDDDHNIYIQNEDDVDATTYTPDFNDETSTQSFRKESKDFISFSDTSVDYKGIESETDYLDSATEKDEDSHIFSPKNYFEISDGEDPIHYTQMNPETSSKVEEYEGEAILDDEADFVNFKRLEDFDINTQDEVQDTSYFTTEFPTSEISTQMPLEILYTEDTTSGFHFIPKSSDDKVNSIPNIVLDSLDKNLGTRESFVISDFDLNLSYQTSTESVSYELLEDSKINDVSIGNSYSEVYDVQQTSEFEESKLNYEVRTFNENISQNNANLEFENTLTHGEVEVFDPISNKELQENSSNENLNLEGKLDSNLTKNIQNESLVSLLEDIPSKSFDSQYHSYDSVVDMNVAEVHVTIQDGTKSIAPTDPPKFKSKHKSLLSDHLIQTDILNGIDLESTEIKDNKEFEDSLETKSSINSLESTRPVINVLNEFESNPTTPSEFLSLKTQDIPNIVSHLQDNAFDPKALYKSMDRLKDVSKSSIVNTVPSRKANIVNKGYSDFQQNIPRTIKNDEKESLLRSHRAFISPYQTDYNLEAFGYQNFGILPYSMLEFKQNNIKKFLPSSVHEHGFEDLAYSIRTGNILESPKISKLISIGKKLLRSKKAKLRILGKYVNSFKTDQ